MENSPTHKTGVCGSSPQWPAKGHFCKTGLLPCIRPGSHLGISRVTLTQPAAGRSVRAVYFYNLVALSPLETGQASPVGTGALYTKGVNLSQTARSTLQTPVSHVSCWQIALANPYTKLVNC